MSKIKIYNIEWNWVVDPYDEPISTQISVGACPFDVWGDEPDDWTESQTGFDQSIFHFLESLDELKSYCKNDGAGEWHIIKYEFCREADLSKI
tara:strand:- start:293 stop:571 length:279 start_codon:yes stop_codon:yes gene_type:complete